MAIKGLIFDFDGLIIETEMPGFIAWSELFKQHGFSLSLEDWKKIIGTNQMSYDPAQHLHQLTRGKLTPSVMRDQTLARTRELIDTQPLLPGVLHFIQTAQNYDIPMAVASSSDRSWVAGYLKKFKISQFFTSVCTSEDVNHVKPDPELFLLAARNIGVAPQQAIVFEDSLNGVKAAKAAGMYCIAIPNEITKTMDFSLADEIVDSFLDLNLVNMLKIQKLR